MIIFIKSQINQVLIGGLDIFFSKLIKLIKFILINILTLFFLPLNVIIKLLSKKIIIRFSIIPANRIGHFIDAIHYI